MLAQMIQFIADPQNTFVEHTVDYLKLCFFPIALSIVISIPVGVLVAQNPLAAFLASNVTGLARAIPTLAIFFLLVQYIGIGLTPSVIALTVLGIPPILLNTVAGLRGIDPAAVEAARGMGMTSAQVLARIRIPLALPVVAAGVRTAAVQIVATAPLAGLIGVGGYGLYIAEAIALVQVVPLLVGAGCVAVLALLVEGGMAAAQHALTPAGLRVRSEEERGVGVEGPTAPAEGEPLAA